MSTKETIPKGIKFAGVATNVKPSGNKDFALFVTDKKCVAAGVYTQNLVHASSIDWNRAITPCDDIRAVAVNSGNANACTGQQGIDDNKKIASLVAREIGAAPEQILVLSTGIIGQPLAMGKIGEGIKSAVQDLSRTAESFDRAAEAILTSDNGPKKVQRSFKIGEEAVTIAAMAKGAGMIGPRMATMLGIVTTDAAIDSELAQRLLSHSVDQSFNRISVEGHTSTNDGVILLCTGESKSQFLDAKSQQLFLNELSSACLELAKMIPADGEGASHLIEVSIIGARDDWEAERVARTVAQSNLVKTAITGNDPNWGRIVSAVGYSPGIEMDALEIQLKLNGHSLYKDGTPVSFDEQQVSDSMANAFETKIEISIGSGTGSSTHWTSDLTKEYVHFNSEYTT